MLAIRDLLPPFAVRSLFHATVLACVVTGASAQSAEHPAAAAVPAPAEATPLSLPDMVARLRASNRSILTKKVEAGVAATGIGRAEAVFQPQLSLAAVRGESRTKNTFEEELIRQSLGIYERTGNDFSAGLSTVLQATGAKLELKSALSRFITNNNQNDPLRPPGAYDNRGSVGFQLTQPLARDAGPEVTQAKLNIARLDSAAAEHGARDTETSVVAEGMLAYYELVFAQRRVEAARDKIRTSAHLLEEAKALHQQGRLAQSDVWEVENALVRYQSALSEAVQNQRERGNKLRAMLMIDPSDALMSASGELPAVDAKLADAQEGLSAALERRDDFQMRKVAVEREGLQLGWAENQSLPRVDLVASYGVNGLEYSGRQALDLHRARDYPTWNLGVQVSVPLGPNKQAEADIQAAVLRRDDALLALKAMEVQIANDIDSSRALLTSMVERWSLWEQVAGREAQQLEAERLKFKAGRSDTRELLLRQERVINAKLSVLEQQLGFARAQTLLQAAQGLLMERFP